MIDERRRQLVESAHAVASLARSREIAPKRVSRQTDDGELRQVLSAIVRRWTLLDKPRWVSTRAATPGSKLDKDHVVPCRVLVDRLIMDPGSCEDVLAHGVALAIITKEEHHRLGGIYVHHAELYGRMLLADPTELLKLGLERYERAQIDLEELASRHKR